MQNISVDRGSRPETQIINYIPVTDRQGNQPQCK